MDAVGVDPENRHQQTFYEIRIKGHLDQRWGRLFGDLMLRLEENGDTVLCGPVVDQAALHGYLRKIRDLGLPLQSVVRINKSPKQRR